MRILLAHPYKHHSFHSLKGIMDYSSNADGVYGYYSRGDILDRLVSLTSANSKQGGWCDNRIDSRRIITSPAMKVRFLVANMLGSYTEKYVQKFDKWAQKQMSDYDALHVIQDYCNGCIRKAHTDGKPIVYEQITAFAYCVRTVIREEIEETGFSIGYCESWYSEKKIEEQLENLEYAKCVIVASPLSKNSLMSYAHKKVYVIPYGINRNHCSGVAKKMLFERKIKCEKLKVLYVGQIYLLKGIRCLINVMEALEEDSCFEFTVVGKPYSEEDRALIERIRGLSNCKYVESIPHSEMDQLYQEHDIFLFQGLCEGFGMVSLEAMSNGLPCLLAEGSAGIVTHGEDGFINANNDVEAVIKKLWTLYEDRELLVRMSMRAIENSALYSWEVYEDNIKKVYEQEFG